MEEKNSIPTSKVARATRLASTGLKVGANYLGYHVERLVGGGASREKLHEKNATSIYGSLSELKGSALKVLQMLSMDQTILPAAYQQQFALSQYSVPPLSYPLVVNIFRKNLGKAPEELFDLFEKKASNAASIGQVHKAFKGRTTYAVKVQYPGVAESVASDLKIVRPFAAKLLNISSVDVDYFFEEVKNKLLEETDYNLELKQSQTISETCKHLPNLVFTEYHQELSCSKILTMTWMEGQKFSEFLLNNPDQNTRNLIGQALWDFYDYQIHTLRQVHADPHPGNFLITSKNQLGVLDFGCVKNISLDFYNVYFKVLKREILDSKELFEEALRDLSFLHPADSHDEVMEFSNIFRESIEILSRPFRSEYFNFSDASYFLEIADFGERASKSIRLRESKRGRGPRDGLYINRTYFGLYNLLHQLKAEVKTSYPEHLL